MAAESMRAGKAFHESDASVPGQAGGASLGASPRRSQAQGVLGFWTLPAHTARSHPEKLKRWVDMSMLPPKEATSSQS